MWFFLNKIRDNCDEIEILYAEIIYWARNAEWILNIEQWIWVFGDLCGIFGLCPINITYNLCHQWCCRLAATIYAFQERESKYYLLIVIDDVDVFADFQRIFNWFKLFQATQCRSNLQMVFIFPNKNVFNVNLAGFLLILTCGRLVTIYRTTSNTKQMLTICTANCQLNGFCQTNQNDLFSLLLYNSY